mmetsp:Transcript_22208/g.66753  ORF Transcript_22208/g.66753 Transcript_22208/m.66753 type:complete len:86 (+) Transcript_22208:2436-2693(+)
MSATILLQTARVYCTQPPLNHLGDDTTVRVREEPFNHPGQSSPCLSEIVVVGVGSDCGFKCRDKNHADGQAPGECTCHKQGVGEQ